MNKKTIATISAAGVAAAAPAGAEIIFTNLATPLTAEADGNTIYFHLSEQWASYSDEMADPQFYINFFANSDQVSISGWEAGIQQVVSFQTEGGWRWSNRLSQGTPISGASNFNDYGNFTFDNDANGEWTAGTRGYVGLRFSLIEEGPWYYGWADVEYDENSLLHLYAFAYDNSGAGIEAGAIPEPKTAAMLMALAAGSAALMARRRKAAAVHA